MFTNRLIPFLQELISVNQSAFVSGRLIIDNVLITFALFHTMKHTNLTRKGTITLKVDMANAYDQVEWTFLERLIIHV